jgi:N-acetylglucosaminyldiphosphoundecaprenol N-acetyl-beta-D-mannosaminyltransferase
MAERPLLWPRQPLLNVWADDLSMDELLQRMESEGGVVFTVNPDHLYHLQYNPAFVTAYRAADIITVDSHYVRLALRLLGRPVAHRLPGSDIVPAFCARNAANPDVRVFLLGARPGVARRALENMNAKAGREQVVGAHGPSMNFVNDPAEIDAVLAMIEASGANVLLVGLGAPKQEIWIASVRHRLPQVRVMMGIGATIDYEAGEVRRAPADAPARPGMDLPGRQRTRSLPDALRPKLEVPVVDADGPSRALQGPVRPHPDVPAPLSTPLPSLARRTP